MKPVQLAANEVVTTLGDTLSPNALRFVIPMVLAECDGKWQGNLGRAQMLGNLSKKHPKQMARHLTEATVAPARLPPATAPSLSFLSVHSLCAHLPASLSPSNPPPPLPSPCLQASAWHRPLRAPRAGCRRLRRPRCRSRSRHRRPSLPPPPAQVIPVLNGLMWDTKPQVKEAATEAMRQACDTSETLPRRLLPPPPLRSASTLLAPPSLHVH